MGRRLCYENEVKLLIQALSITALLCISFPTFAQSVTDGVIINADSMLRDLEKRTVTLKGNVQVVFKGQHLSCDRAKLNLKTQKIEAEGHVILTNDKIHMEGDRLVFNYKANTGLVFNGFVQSGHVVFEGDVIEKTGETHYIATNADFTACETCPAGWSFSGRTIDAEVGGYARIRRAVFRIGNIPVMLLPGLIVPLKSSRQSGFLVPQADISGKDGIAPALSYFWAIDKSQDFTFTPQWYTHRGIKTRGEYRYVLSDESRGAGRGAWLEDRTFSKEQKIRDTFDRWFVNYSHHYELPNGYVQRADFIGMSDLFYPRDFFEELNIQGWGEIENRTSISKTTEDQNMSAEVGLYRSMLKDDPLSNNDDAVNRFPEIRYNLKETQLFENGPFFNFRLDYVNFARSKYAYDDLAIGPDAAGNTVLKGINGATLPGSQGVGPQGAIMRDGIFDIATDKMRTGQRVDMSPTLTYPFQIAQKFDVLPLLTYRETQYRFTPPSSAQFPSASGTEGFSPTAARRYLEGQIFIKTEFSRVFGTDDPNPEATRWKHSIEPEIGYSRIPWERRPDHPFFGRFDNQRYNRQYDSISDSDIINGNTGLQFDYEDRTYNKQVIDFSLNNRLMKKTFINGMADYRRAVQFNIGQSYDLNEAHSTLRHPWSATTALLDARFDRFETYTTAAYNPYARVTNLSSRVRGNVNPKNFLEIAYTRNFILTDTDQVANNGETRNISFGVGVMNKYFDGLAHIDLEAREFKSLSSDYVLNLKPPGRCWIITLKSTIVPGGERKIHASVSFDFGGENHPD